MTEHERGQVTRSAAEIYDEFFVPALFRQWAARVVDAAGIRPGERVIDVGCGTGVLARAVAERVGAGGAVVGVDVNEGMLAVAARRAPAIEWRLGRAEELPFASGSFDAVVSQFSLMFFEDPTAALRDMMRVLRPGGRLAVAVWAPIETSPGYAALLGILRRLFGEEAAAALRAPFLLGDGALVRSLFESAGIDGAMLTTCEGTARFGSIREWMHTEVRGWTLADRLDDAAFARLLAEAERELERFAPSGGAVAFAAPAHLVTAAKGG